MLNYDELNAAKQQFRGVLEDATMFGELGVLYDDDHGILIEAMKLALMLCDRYERDALSRPNHPLRPA